MNLLAFPTGLNHIWPDVEHARDLVRQYPGQTAEQLGAITMLSAKHLRRRLEVAEQAGLVREVWGRWYLPAMEMAA